MNVKIAVPVLGESISEATIAKWHKKQGELVKIDELLLELETEKVTLEVNAQADGIIESINKKEGESVTVGEILGNIKTGISATSSVESKITVPPSKQEKIPIDPLTAIPVSAAKLIAENNLNPSSIAGTGKDGRINKIDVLNAIDNARIDTKNDIKKVEKVKLSRLRKTIAKRLKDSQNTAAILTTFNEIDMSAVIALRKKYKEIFQEKHGIKLGFMSFFVKAVISALKAVPSVNAQMDLTVTTMMSFAVVQSKF